MITLRKVRKDLCEQSRTRQRLCRINQYKVILHDQAFRQAAFSYENKHHQHNWTKLPFFLLWCIYKMIYFIPLTSCRIVSITNLKKLKYTNEMLDILLSTKPVHPSCTSWSRSVCVSIYIYAHDFDSEFYNAPD